MSRSPADNDDDLFDADEAPAQPAKKGRKRKGSGNKSTPAWVIIVIVLAGVPLMMCPCLIALLLPAVQQAREAARRTQARNSMKQIGLAMHNFHDTMQHFPPKNVVGEEAPGEFVQSWMTDILPYVDQSPLHRTIDYGKKWDDPANRQAFGTVVPTYLNPSAPANPIDQNGFAIAHFAANSLVVSDQRHLGIRDITDGTSNTILMGTVDAGFRPWGDPANHRDPANGARGGPQAFGSPHTGIVMFLLADGSVRTVSQEIDPAVLQLMGDPADGQALPPGALDY